jgi:hypothetical protein
VTVLCGDGGWLLPLAVEAVVDEGVVGIHCAWIGTIPTGTTRACTAPLGI